jgi:predicted phage-related endonuclease
MSAEPVERRFLGGTAAAALAGVNPPRWAQPIDVYLELTGQAPPRQRNSAMMAMGRLLEEVVADLFTEATGVTLRRPPRLAGYTCAICAQDGLPGCSATISATRPWAGGHLDRWASDGGVFEAKWSQRRDEWGEGHTPDTALEVPARIPARYAVQVQHYLSVTGRDFAYLAVLLGYGDFRWYYLPRRAEAIAQLEELEDRFWHENVVLGIPPEPDGSEGYSRHLRRALAQDDGLEAVATPEQQLLAHRLQHAREALAEATRDVAREEQALQASMGTTAKLVGPDFTISWATTTPRLKVHTDDALEALVRHSSVWASIEWPKTKKAAKEAVREYLLANALAHEEPGTRPFTPHFDSDEEDQA